jgi:hypothetical protein
MTTEQNQPQAQPSSQAQPAGQNEGQGHRRRRRRRKGYSNNQAKGQPNAEATQTAGPAANPPKKAAKPKSSNQGRFGKSGGSHASSSNSNGSNGSGGGGGRRKGKGRRQPAFVGPMDHSYRTVNGNTAEASHGGAEYRSNGNGNGHYVDPGPREVAAAPVREDSPVRIYCFIEDLFFLAKIQETARKLGVKVSFVKADKDIVARLADVPEGSRPSLIVFDLNNVNAKPLTLIPRLKSKMKRGTSVIGFLSHLQGDLKAKAMEAGCDMVMPRSAFSQNLPNLLRRHGLDSELEALEA